MKLLYSLVLSLVCAGFAHAQKTEFSVQVHTNASFFGGNSAEKSTSLSLSDTGGDHYLNETYGTKAGIGFGAGLQVQRVTSYSLLLGLQLSAEQLRSKIEIAQINGFRQTTHANGDATLKLNAVNLQPYVGWRVPTAFADVDILPGTEAGYITGGTYKGEATDENNDKFSFSGDRGEQELDVRAKVGLTAYKGHLGLGLSYAHGLINYRSDWNGGSGELYSRVFRLSLIYRI